MPGTADPDLYVRLTELLGTRDVRPEDRTRIRDAFGQAQTWEDLPPEIQDLIETLEKLPAQSWDDPSDVPDQIE